MPLRAARRVAEHRDQTLAYDVREQAMREYEEATWGSWNIAKAQAQIAEDIAARRLIMIEIDQQAAGMMRIDEHPTHIQIDQLFLLPKYQNLGIGTEIIEQVLQNARKKNQPVKLWVLRVNPALSLYQRLGFRVVQETAASLYLQSAA